MDSKNPIKSHKKFSCQYCGKNLASNRSLEKHESKCTQKTSHLHILELGMRDQEISRLKLVINDQDTYINDLVLSHTIDTEDLEKKHTIEIQKLDQEISRLKNIIIKQKKSRKNVVAEILDSHKVHIEDLKSEHEKLTLKQDRNILYLQSVLANLAELGIKNGKNTTIKNIANFNQKYYDNMEPLTLTKSVVDAGILNFTEKDIENHPESTADAIVRNLLTDSNGHPKYVCVDINKKKFTYKDDNGELQTDTECKMLFEKISPTLFPYIGRIYQEKMDKAKISGDIISDLHWRKKSENFTITRAKKDLTREITKQVPHKSDILYRPAINQEKI